jgi:hypothetical protein
VGYWCDNGNLLSGCIPGGRTPSSRGYQQSHGALYQIQGRERKIKRAEMSGVFGERFKKRGAKVGSEE